jgi:glycosyltransferase involved in cell wall biosynthesis
MSHIDIIICTGFREKIFLEKNTKKNILHMPSAPDNLFNIYKKKCQLKKYDVITIANLVHKKNLITVCMCAKKLLQYKFCIIGDGPLRGEIEFYLKRYNIDNVYLMGALEPKLVEKALRSSKLFFLPSFNEGTPTAVIEAMKSGVPVLLTPSNDYSWLIKDDINGYLIDSWNIENLISKLNLILKNQSKLNLVASRARDAVEEISWENNSKKLNELIKKILIKI